MVTLLERAGHAVIESSSVAQALALCRRKVPKLVILDQPAADVIAFCQATIAQHPRTFILQILVGDDQPPGDDDDLGGVSTSRIDALLVDPVDPRELLTLVGSLLRLQQVEIDLRESEERLELAQEAAGLAILDWGIPTNSLVHSEAFADLFDLPPRKDGEALTAATLLERILPEDLAPLLADFAGQGQTARSFDKEFRIVLRDGRIRWIAARGRMFIDPAGMPQRMLSLSFDITQRKESERVNAQLASIVASSIDAIVSVDLDNNITTWNEGAERLFGFTHDELIGGSLDRVLVQAGDAAVEHRRKLVLGEASVFESNQTTKDGGNLDISVNSAPMRAADGIVIGASLIMRDIAPLKKREDHVRFLMRELTHRSKNLLAVIQAMARQSLNKEIAPEEFVKRFSNRLNGLAGSHDLLSAVDWKGASLVDLIHSQLRHYEDLFGTRIVLRGDEIVIKPEAAQNIGITLHELSTNAAKYGALSVAEGRVTIEWRIDDALPPRLTMIWREEDGPSVSAPTRRGFGHIVMDRIAGQALNGKSSLQFKPTGVLWTLDVPAAAVLHG